MDIQEYSLDQKALRSAYRSITSFSAHTTSKDPSIATLLKKGSALTTHVADLDNLRTQILPKLLARLTSASSTLSPHGLLELLQLRQEGSLSPQEQEELDQEIRNTSQQWSQCSASMLYGPSPDKPLSSDNIGLLPLLKRMGDICYAVGQSDLAEYVVEVYNKKQQRLSDLAAWSQKTLLPLIQDLSLQIQNIDSQLATQLNTNFFDSLLKLMPSQAVISSLGTQVDQSMFSSAPVTSRPLPPLNSQSIQTGGTQTTGTQTTGTQTAGTQTAGTQTAGTQTAGTQTAGTQTAGTQTAGTQTAGTQTPSASNIPIIVQMSSGGEGGGSSAVGDLSTATPEAVALKASYEVLQNSLQFMSDSVSFSQYVSQRIELSRELEELKQRYEEAANQYREIELDLYALDTINTLLNNISDYVGQFNLLETTLNGYFQALSTAQKYPAPFYETYQMLTSYLESLQLVWR